MLKHILVYTLWTAFVDLKKDIYVYVEVSQILINQSINQNNSNV